MRFLIDFGEVWGVFWEGFGAMLAPRATHIACKILINVEIFIDFGSILGGFWEAFGGDVGFQDALKIELQF